MAYQQRAHGTQAGAGERRRPASAETDFDLVDRVLQRDTAAFGQLVKKYQDRLLTTITHLTPCTAEAEDVVQEAFLQCFRKLDTFQRKSSFFTWLYRIAINIAQNKRRRVRREVPLDNNPSVNQQQLVDAGSSASDSLERKDEFSMFRDALASLKEESRSVLVLRELDECSYEEIAAILGVPLGTVRSRLYRARVELRNALVARGVESAKVGDRGGSPPKQPRW